MFDSNALARAITEVGDTAMSNAKVRISVLRSLIDTEAAACNEGRITPARLIETTASWRAEFDLYETAVGTAEATAKAAADAAASKASVNTTPAASQGVNAAVNPQSPTK